jgi:hypothetical protein
MAGASATLLAGWPVESSEIGRATAIGFANARETSVVPVTLLAAVDCGDHVLLASDGKALQIDRAEPDGFAEVKSFRTKKFRRVGTLPLMFGIIGRGPSGPALERLLEPRVQLDSWEAAVAFLVEEAGRIREMAQRAAKRAQPKSGEQFDTHFLLGGVFDGAPRVALVNSAGEAQYPEQWRPSPWFFGVNSMTVSVAYQVAHHYRPDLDLQNPEELRTFIELLHDLAPDIQSPADVWSVDSTDVVPF